MDYTSTPDTCCWEIDISPYKEQRFREADSLEEYEESVRAISDILDSLGSSAFGLTEERLEDNPIDYGKLTVRDEACPARFRVRFTAEEEPTEEEIIEAREAYLDAFETILGEGIEPYRTIYSDDWYNAGIIYEADPTSSDPIQVHTDPEFEGRVMQIADEG